MTFVAIGALRGNILQPANIKGTKSDYAGAQAGLCLCHPHATVCLYMFQVFRLEDYACLYTLHGHTSSITALYLDKVTISSFLILI